MAASNSWCFWADKLSWFVLSLFIWQIVATAVTFLDKVTAWSLPTYINVALWVPDCGDGTGLSSRGLRTFSVLHQNHAIQDEIW